MIPIFQQTYYSRSVNKVFTLNGSLTSLHSRHPAPVSDLSLHLTLLKHSHTCDMKETNIK